MTDVRNYPRHLVRGDYMTDEGYLRDYTPKSLLVYVSPDGDAYEPEFGTKLVAEVWGDCVRLGRNFAPDTGELKRCGIRATRCGSATQEHLDAA